MKYTAIDSLEVTTIDEEDIDESSISEPVEGDTVTQDGTVDMTDRSHVTQPHRAAAVLGGDNLKKLDWKLNLYLLPL